MNYLFDQENRVVLAGRCNNQEEAKEVEAELRRVLDKAIQEYNIKQETEDRELDILCSVFVEKYGVNWELTPVLNNVIGKEFDTQYNELLAKIWREPIDPLTALVDGLDSYRVEIEDVASCFPILNKYTTEELLKNKAGV